MAADPPAASPDDAFNQFQQKLVVDFSTKFDAWVARVNSRPTLSITASAVTGTMADLMAGPVTDHVSDNTVELVYDLARLCRSFVMGDLWAWAFLQRRQGSTVEEVLDC